MLTGSPVVLEPASNLSPGRPTRQIRKLCTLYGWFARTVKPPRNIRNQFVSPCKPGRGAISGSGASAARSGSVPAHVMARRLIEEYLRIGRDDRPRVSGAGCCGGSRCRVAPCAHRKGAWWTRSCGRAFPGPLAISACTIRLLQPLKSISIGRPVNSCTRNTSAPRAPRKLPARCHQ
jgi:hypothetical protein